MRKLYGSYYGRLIVFHGNQRDKQRQKEVTIPLKTKSKMTADRRMLVLEQYEDVIKNGILTKDKWHIKFTWLKSDNKSCKKMIDSLRDVIPTYLHIRRTGGVVRKETADRDEYALKQLVQVLGEDAVVQDLNHKDIERKFIPYYKNKNYSNNGINIALRTLKIFFNYLLREKLIKEKITFKMLPKEEKECYINRAEIDALHELVDDRMSRWFYFYEKTGCRATDPFKGFLEGDVWKISPAEAKAKHWHYYPLSKELQYIWMELQDLRQSYEDEGRTKEEAIKTAYRLIQKNMYRAIRELKLTGVISKDKKLTPKSFRHTFGIINVHITGNIYAVRDMLNHTNVNTTQEYLDMPSYLVHQEFPEVVQKSNFRGESIPQSSNTLSPLTPPAEGVS